jgi:hypothetical protein
VVGSALVVPAVTALVSAAAAVVGAAAARATPRAAAPRALRRQQHTRRRIDAPWHGGIDNEGMQRRDPQRQQGVHLLLLLSRCHLIGATD